MTENQKLSLLLTVMAASIQLEEVEIDLKPSEGSRIQTKLLEFIEVHGEEQAETLIKTDLKDAVRALYDDLTKG